MSTKLILKKSTISGKVPTSGDLSYGELALNYADGRIYYKDNTDTIRSFVDSDILLEYFNQITDELSADLMDSQEVVNLIDSVYLLTHGYNSGSFDVDFLTKTTDSLAEGSLNQYYTQLRVDSDITAKVTKVFVDALGVDAATLNSQTPSYYLDYSNFTNTPHVFDSADVRNLFSAGNGLEYDSATGQFSVPIGGLVYTTVDFDSDFTDKTTSDLAEGSNLYYTTARADSDFDTRLTTKTTADLTEGSNLYYTAARVDSDFDARLATKSTDNVAEGSNLYYTTTRANTDFDTRLATKSTDNVAEGSNLYYTDARANAAFDVSLSGKSTTDLAEGSNLYYTTARVNTDFDTRLATKSTDDVAEGANLYYTTARANTDFDTRLGTKSTDDVAEGANLYYTTARADSDAKHSVSGGTGVSYTPSTGVIAIGQPVGTSDDVTFGKVTADSANLGVIDFVPQTSAPMNQAGALYWDSDPQKGLSFIPTTNEGATDVTINIGQELLIYVHNQTGETIANGDVVQVVGTAHGAHPLVSKAQANTAINGQIAVATQDIVDNAHGYVTRLGLVRDVNTGGLTSGDDIYLSLDSAGKWSTTNVSIDNGYPYHVGKVLAVDSSAGSILVDPFIEHFEYLRIQDHLKVDGPIEGTSYMGTYFDFDGTAPAHKEGRVWYDSANGALAIYNQISDITMQVGQLQWVKCYNNSGSTILNGKAVYVASSHGGTPSIDLASASTEASSYALGLATHDIPNGTYGYVTQSGVVNDVNTSAFVPGDRLHISVTPGELQVTVPPYPAFANEIGEVLLSDSTGGKILVNRQPHTFETIRSTGDGRIDGNLTVGGNLNVVGTTTEARTQSLTVTSNIVKLLDGDTLGTSYQNYSVPAGLDDATFRGNYTGDSDIFLFIRMVSLDSTGDVIEFGISDSDTIASEQYGVPFDSAGGPTTWNLLSDGLTAPLRNSISIEFLNATGHADSDLWCAHPTELNLDLGMVGNYNPAGPGGLRYTGVYRDAGDGRWKFFDNSTQPFGDPNATQFEVQDSAGVGYALADVQADTFYGALSGNATSANIATILQTSRSFSLSGEVTTTSPQTFNGSANVVLPVIVADDVIDNANIKAAAGIVDSKLATISTAGKVQNSATTATSANTGSAIVARDASGNFSAGTITAALSGNASTATTLATGRNFSISGDVTASAISFDGSGNVALSAAITAGSIVNADINASAAIADTKLATISTSGKVSNSATTATNANVDNAIVARDALGNFSAGTITAALSGNASTATTLQTARTIAISGDITGTATSFDGGSNISISSAITAGAIVNADINASAAIADTKLATISTSGKVSNSATTATSANTASAIVARDASGNFSAGTVTAALSGNATTATTLQTARTIAISGDVTGTATSFNGGSNISISAAITANTIVNADINSSAAIADTKLATISTAGKVSNSATTATNANTANAIVSRDASGNFSAGTITASLSGNATTATTATNAGNADTVDGLHAASFMRAASLNGYYGLVDPAGSASTWIRTTVNGLIPYQSGGASSLGTSSWPFTSVYATTMYGRATSANWADLAERYHADAEYDVGTVLGIGGDNEVTLYQPGMPVAGVVSNEPGFRMNDGEEKRDNPLWPFVALKGRVPVKICGPARKGQYIIAYEDGLGRAVDYSSLINNLEVIGVALEDGIDMVEVKV